MAQMGEGERGGWGICGMGEGSRRLIAVSKKLVGQTVLNSSLISPLPSPALFIQVLTHLPRGQRTSFLRHTYNSLFFLLFFFTFICLSLTRHFYSMEFLQYTYTTLIVLPIRIILPPNLPSPPHIDLTAS